MKATIGIFLAGVAAAFLLDPTSGRDRRARVNGWARPVSQRLRRAKDRAADSDTLKDVRESAVPGVAQALKNVAIAVQGGVVDASSAVAARAGRAVGHGDGESEEAGTQGETARSTAEVRSVEVAPKPGLDPIPEGETNDPTLVSRVESELFRDGSVPKGRLNIDAANGVVTLRGSLDGDAQAEDIVERTRAIEGVAEVVDLLQRR